jgi:nucleoid DNA-binding protein
LRGDLLLTAKTNNLDITPFIHDLILLNECVILRDFGGFETSYKHAVLNKDTKTLVPPSKKITFRPEWLKDNGVLERYIAESLKIKPEKASGYISAYVEDLNKKLKEEGSVFLEGIGKFQLNDNKKIIFTSIEDENYLADSFGLDMLEVDIEHVQAGISEPVTSIPSVYKKRKFMGWYIAIGILLLFIAVTAFILISGKSGLSDLRFFSKNNKKQEESEMVIFGKLGKNLKDSVTKSIEQNLDKKTIAKNALSFNEQEKSIKSETTSRESEATSKPVMGVTYYLVAGSFKSSKNAEMLKDKLLKKGFSPEIINTNGNFTMVVVGTYISKDQANEELIRIRRKLGQSVWLMEK